MNKLKILYIMFLSAIVCLFIISLFYYPQEVIKASKNGILLWFNSVFPALFTFIIGANLLIGLGFVNFIGVLLEPLMRSVFNLPGASAFAAIMGVASGYPVGAKLTVDLRQQNLLSKEEAMRLISFSNNSGPLFLLGAIGIGMYNSVHIGLFLMFVHYAAALSTGLLFRFYKANRKSGNFKHEYGNILKKAIYDQRASYKKDGRKFGVLLGDSVKNAMEVVTQIGGFIVLFSVVVSILRAAGITEICVNTIKPLIKFIGFNQNICEGLFIGIIEMTNGANIISNNTGPIIEKLAVTGMIISFSGLSIHAQTIAIISRSDIKVSFYILAKTVNAFFALGYGLLLFPLVQSYTHNAVFVNSSFNINPLNSFLTSLISFSIVIIVFVIITFFKATQKKKTKRKC